MALKTTTRWYIAFATILTAIGTFIATTDPVFHYHDIFGKDQIDTTKLVKTVPKLTLDSLANTNNTGLPLTLRQMDKKIRTHEKKIVEHDTLIHKTILGDQ